MQTNTLSTTMHKHAPLKVLKNFVIYLGGALTKSFFPLIFAPLIMVLLSPAQWGLLSFIQSFENVVIACVSLGLPTVFLTEYFRCAYQEQHKLLNNILFVYITCMAPFGLITFLYRSSLAAFLHIPESKTFLMYALLLNCFFSFFNDLFFQFLQCRNKAFTVSIFQAVATGLAGL